MPIEYLKQVAPVPAGTTATTSDIVKQILNNIEQGGEEIALEYAKKFDRYEGNIVLTSEEIQSACDAVPNQIKEDIIYAYNNIKRFAEKQREHIHDFEFETSPGFFTGQKCIPLDCCGCYVPGGRYSHIASAIMTVTTAKVAGCKNISVSTMLLYMQQIYVVQTLF